jgi:hypothetical protein
MFSSELLLISLKYSLDSAHFGASNELLFLPKIELLCIIVIMKNLLNETMALAREMRRSKCDVALECGFSARWLHKLLAGQIKNPGVVHIQRLHDVLAAEQAKRVNPPDSSLPQPASGAGQFLE